MQLFFHYQYLDLRPGLFGSGYGAILAKNQNGTKLPIFSFLETILGTKFRYSSDTVLSNFITV